MAFTHTFVQVGYTHTVCAVADLYSLHLALSELAGFFFRLRRVPLHCRFASRPETKERPSLEHECMRKGEGESNG